MDTWAEPGCMATGLALPSTPAARWAARRGGPVPSVSPPPLLLDGRAWIRLRALFAESASDACRGRRHPVVRCGGRSGLRQRRRALQASLDRDIAAARPRHGLARVPRSGRPFLAGEGPAMGVGTPRANPPDATVETTQAAAHRHRPARSANDFPAVSWPVAGVAARRHVGNLVSPPFYRFVLGPARRRRRAANTSLMETERWPFERQRA